MAGKRISADSQWVVIREVGRAANRQIVVEAKCACGTIKQVQLRHIRSGASRSCGCLFKRSAGQETQFAAFFSTLPSRLPGQCHEWPYATNDKGYGTGLTGQGTNLVHRAVFIRLHGYAPEAVMHTCDNPKCCNPDHLVAGTVALNNKDMFRKRRNRTTPRYGEQHHNSKLSAVDVRDIYTAKATPRQLAERYGVTPENIRYIRSGTTWRAITEGLQRDSVPFL